MDFKPLRKEFESKGFSYKEVIRYPDNWCIYSQTSLNTNTLIAYEVFQTYVAPAYKLHGNVIPAKEFWPSDNSFGFKAWSLPTLQGAKNKMEEIKNRKEEKQEERTEFQIPIGDFTTKQLSEYNKTNYVTAFNWVKENLNKKIVFIEEKHLHSGRGKKSKIFRKI